MAQPQTDPRRIGRDRSASPEVDYPAVPLIDAVQAAERLGVTPRFVRRLVDERRIRFYKIGKYIRFDPADIDRFTAAARVEPPDALRATRT